MSLPDRRSKPVSTNAIPKLRVASMAEGRSPGNNRDCFAAKVENPQCKEIESPKGFPRHVQRSGGSRHYFRTGSYAKGYSLWIEAELEIGEMRF
jgi:hypothetical protein